MSFPRYEKYRESGVEWLGLIPAHWTVMPLKRDIEFVTSGARGWAENYSDDGDVFIRIGNLTRESIRLDLADVQRVVVPAGAEGARTLTRPGDLLFSITAYLGSVAVVPANLGKAYVSQHVALVRPTFRRIVSEWAAYVALSYVGRTFLETQGYGGTKIQLSLDDVANLLLVVPPLAEQRELVAFLDRETAKIDALVEEQQRLIELLKEKRQAVISHAVTKGLKPNAPMKDTEVEWLGEMPAHWQLLRLKNISPQVTVGIVVEPSKYYAEQGVPALRSLNVKPGAVMVEGMVFISDESNDLLSKSKLRSGDLVAVRSGQPGTTAVIPPELDGCNCIDLIVIRKPETGSEEFLCWYLNSDTARMQFSQGSGGAIQQHFNVETATSLLVPWPPAGEQVEIARALHNQANQLDSLVAEAELGVELLRERRTALISAAVTGKIDVRSKVPLPEPA